MPQFRSTPQPNGTVIMQSYHLSFYVVSATESFWISTDAAGATTDIFAGRVVQQSGGPFTIASLNATGVLSLTGKNQANQNSDVVGGKETPDGAGQLGGMGDESDIFGQYPDVSMFVGSYQIPANGRIAFSPLVFYMVSARKGIVFEMDTNQHQPSVIVIEK